MKNFNRLNDIYFKRLLGTKKRKNLTLSFLNAILNKDNTNYFTDITFLDKDYEPSTLDGKLSKLDIRADLNDGTQIDIEVQVCPFKFMAERSLYYWSKMYAEQLDKGDEYGRLQRAITINLLAFNFLELESDWHNIYNLLNIKSHNRLTNHIELHFLELPKFSLKDIQNLKTSEAWLAYFSGKYTKQELEEISMMNPVIKEAVEYEDTFLKNKIERRAYEQREKAIRDHYSYISAYKEEGLEQGKKEGLQQGIQQGIEQEKHENAINLLKLGVDIHIISTGLNISIEELEQLKNQLK